MIYMGYKTQSITITRSDEDTFKAGHFFILSNNPFQCRLFIDIRKDITHTALKHQFFQSDKKSDHHLPVMVRLPAEREIFCQRRRNEPPFIQRRCYKTNYIMFVSYLNFFMSSVIPTKNAAITEVLLTYKLHIPT